MLNRWNSSLLLLSIALGTPGICAAQDRQPLQIKVGDPMVDGAILKPYKNLWKMSILTRDGKTVPDLGTWSDELDVVKIAGREYLRRTQIAHFIRDGQPLGETKTVNVFDPKTLAPVSRWFERHTSKGGDSVVKIDFGLRSLKMESTENGKTETKDVPVDVPAYDFYGGLYGIVLTAFPLEEGFFASFSSFGETDISPQPVTFKVTRSEVADAGPRGKMKTWVVLADTTDGPMKFWLSREAPYIIRLEYNDKRSGTQWTYAMI